MHYHLIVIGNGALQEMMEPFDQNLEVEKYLVGNVREQDRERMVEYYNDKEHGHPWCLGNFDELYAQKGYDWNFNTWQKDPDGVWREYSTSNPNMKWDWYEVGGRWPGQLKIKEGVEYHRAVQFSWGWSEKDKREFLKNNPRCADVALKGDIENLGELTAYSILKNGEWIEAEGFDGTLRVADYLNDVPDNTLITSVDYHF